MEHQKKKLATLHNELEKIAMIGYDESFGGFVELMIEQVKTDERLQHEEKKRRIEDFNTCLLEYKLLKENIDEGKN